MLAGILLGNDQKDRKLFGGKAVERTIRGTVIETGEVIQLYSAAGNVAF